MTRRCLTCHTIIRSGSRCPSCQRAYSAQRNELRGGSGWAWQATRQAVIERDGTCVMADGSCSGPARVDHVVPLVHGGTNDLANLRLLCLHHHQAVTIGGGG